MIVMSKEMNIFEYAVRNKLRFPYRGSISAEDLWDLPLTALDGIFKSLNKDKKQSQEESLLETKSKENEALDVAIEIVKYVVTTKQAEAAAKTKARENKEKKEKLMAILANKEEEVYKNMSVEEIRKLIAEM